MRDEKCEAESKRNAAPPGQDARPPNRNCRQDGTDRNSKKAEPEEPDAFPKSDRICENHKQVNVILSNGFLTNGMQCEGLGSVIG